MSSPNSRIIETTIRSDRQVPGYVDQRYILKCNFCLWNTSYVDLSGNLNLSDNSMPCPRCRKGVIKVQSLANRKIFNPPAYLDYVLSD